MSEWEEATLGKLVDIKHGYAFKGEFFTEIPNKNALLTPGNFHIGGGFKADKFKYYIGEFPEEYVLSPGDVIVTMTDLSKEGDTLGYSARIPEGKIRFLHNQRLGLVSTISNKADINFIYWLLRTSHYQKTIVNSCSGSTVKHTSPSRIKSYEFLLPPIAEQIAIDKVLSSLDRKIENLRRQNETLERIAQTLFKHWFVDFEFPNDDGKPYRSSGGEMVRSELGEIPAGWQFGNLDDVLSLIIDYRGKTPKKLGSDWSLTGIPALSAKNIKDGRIVREDAINFLDKDLYKKWMKDELQKGDILLTSEAPLGEVFYLANNKKYVLSQRLFSLRTKARFDSTYLYFWLKSPQGQFLLERRATGSTVEGIRQVELRKVEIIIPALDILEKAAFLWLVALEKIENNSQQIQTLTKTRDVLLPKLMSGKLRITE